LKTLTTLPTLSYGQGGELLIEGEKGRVWVKRWRGVKKPNAKEAKHPVLEEGRKHNWLDYII